MTKIYSFASWFRPDSVQWETAMTSLTGGGGTSSGERGATWSVQERGRRGGGMTGLTGELTLTNTFTSLSPCVCSNHECVCAEIGTVAERGGGTTTVVTESGSLRRDTLARSTNA